MKTIKKNKYIILLKNKISEISIYSEITIKEGDLYPLVSTLNKMYEQNNLKFYSYEMNYYKSNKENIINELLT